MSTNLLDNPRILEMRKSLGYNYRICCVMENTAKICYDNPGNVPYKGRNFNTQTLGKMYLFVICMINRHWFQTKLLLHIAQFLRFWGKKMSFLHYIINQKLNNFIKHCSPPCTKKPLISEMCIYIKSSLCKWGLGTRGERCSIYKKSQECLLTTHKIHYSQWKITSIVHFMIKA